MSVIDLAVAKSYLDVIHDDDDEKLQMLLDGAEDEALQFMDRKTFGGICPCHEVLPESPSSSDISSESEPVAMPPAVQVGVLVLLEAAYQAPPDYAEKLRKITELKLFPYRCQLGV